MESKTNYTIVGIIVLILGASLLFVSVWLSSGFNSKQYDFYTVFLHEAAAGLSEDSAVKFNGVQVGFVKKIKLNPTDPRQVEITLSIERHTPITTSTFATLISQGITGVTYVGLSAGSSDLTPLQKMPGEPYPVIPAKPSLFNQLDSILKNVSVNVNKLSEKAQLIFNEENALYVKNTLANMERFSDVIAKNSKHVSNSLKSADVFLANISKASRDLPEVMNKLKQGSESVSETMRAGKNAVDKISQQTLPPTITLINRLNAIAANMEKVSKEMRQNPSVLIRGIQPPKSGPGE
ncbi:MAG: MCE family protein [Legionella sp.]|nr:MCE family protein [Legionella sp.]